MMKARKLFAHCPEALLWASLALRVFIGGLFVWSGLAKLQNGEGFYQAVLAYGVLPSELLVRVVAIGLPWFEIITGGYVIIGLFTRWAVLAIVAMLVVFLGLIAWMLLQGKVVDCGCFVAGVSEPLSWKKFGEDVVLLLMTLGILQWPGTAWGIDRFLGDTTETGTNA